MKTGDLRLADCINETCPWSGKPVQADSLTLYQGHVVGFCNPGCRDKFEQAISAVREGARRRAPAKAKLTGQPATGNHPRERPSRPSGVCQDPWPGGRFAVRRELAVRRGSEE